MRPPSSPGSAAEAFDAELRLIAEQAQMLTLASGAAIALRQGEFMLCYARAGDGAPALGAQLDTQSGLSGECVRTARTLVCADTENDPRVNLDVCRYLGIRSIAVLPICLGREVVGVFEAFSAHPSAFSANEMAALESMRDLVISVIRPEPPAETAAPSALGAIIAEDELPLTPLRRDENPAPPAPFRPIRSWPLETSRTDQNTEPPVRPVGAPVLHEPQEAAPFRPVAAMPPLAPFQHPISSEPEDDLLCEIEQRESAAPPSDAESLKRAFQLFDANSSQPAPPRSPAPPSSPILPRSFAVPVALDPDDDLICEIEARSIPPAPILGEPHPAHANAFSAFTPAPVRPPEHQVSRKLIVAGVVVALGGLLWLRWCNHAQQVKGPATPASTVQAAVPPAPNAAPAGTPSQPAASAASVTSTAPATSKPPAASTAPPEDKLTSTEEASDSPQPRTEARPLQAARPSHAPASTLGGQKRLPRPSPQTHERAALKKTSPPAPAPSPSSATLATPPPNAGQPSPRAFTAPPAEQLRAAAVPANPPPQASPPTFTLKPAPAPAVPPPPTGQLSLSQAVVKSSPESSAADTLSPDALRLLLDSAKAGDAGAQLALAVRYANGDGVRQSYPEAFKWFRRAQAQGAVPRQGKAAELWSKVQEWAQSHPQEK